MDSRWQVGGKLEPFWNCEDEIGQCNDMDFLF